jgi:glycosyltransferase involved in cell wall biosynthesis
MNYKSLTIAFLGYEYFGHKKNNVMEPTSIHGGFGFVTRQKAEYLAKIGLNVHVIVPAISYDRENNENWETEKNGVYLHLYKSVDKFSENIITNSYGKFAQHWLKNKNLDRILKSTKIDMFQSEEPGMFTLQALKYSNRQLIVFQDPFSEEDFRIMNKAEIEYRHCLNEENSYKYRELNRLKLVLLSQSRNYVKKILNKVSKSSVYSEAHFISEKVKKMYNLNYLPGYLPNPYEVKSEKYIKSSNPSIMWIGRFEPQKRPDIALEIASKLPDIDFHFVGRSGEFGPFRDIETRLQQKYSKFNNIHFHKFVSEETKFELLGKSWILLNTSVREGIPVTFLEAMNTKTCIVASVDPDQYTSKFGIKVNGNDYETAIREALKDDTYITKGNLGFQHLKETHEISKVMHQHLAIYESLMK